MAEQKTDPATTYREMKIGDTITAICYRHTTRSEDMIIDGASVKINFASKQPSDAYRNIERILLQAHRFGVKKAHKQ